MICMKHPYHKQQPGVCSCCLNEKLSKFSLGDSSSNDHQFSLSSNIYSPSNYHFYSSGSSTSSSPSHSRGHHHRTTSDVLSSSFVPRGGGGGNGGEELKKSRSIAVTVRGRGGGVRDGVNRKKKKQGFWSKLIKSTTGERTKRNLHPRMKDVFA